MQHKIKEHFRGVPDEFMTHEFAIKAKVSDYVGISHAVSAGIRLHSHQRQHNVHSQCQNLNNVAVYLIIASRLLNFHFFSCTKQTFC